MEMSREVRWVVVIDTGTKTGSWSESPHFKEDAGAAKSLSGPSTAPCGSLCPGGLLTCANTLEREAVTIEGNQISIVIKKGHFRPPACLDSASQMAFFKLL